MQQQFFKGLVPLFLAACLVMAGALYSRANPAGGVSVQAISFPNKAITLAGNLYLPEGFDAHGRYSAVICVHPAGSVKEQTAGLYARRLAEQGFVTLAFDASYVGESGGEPRYVEDPFARMEDIHCAVDYLTTLPYVDEERIGALGICAGGGYVMAVTPTERRIKAAVGVSTADIGSTNRDGWLGGASVEAQIAKLEAVAAQRTREARGAAPLWHPITPDTLEGDASGAFANPALRDLERKSQPGEAFPATFVEAYDYYRTPRGQHPRSVNRMLFVSGDKKMLFSAVNVTTKLFTQPVLFVVGSRADSRHHSQAIYDAIPGTNKEIYTIEGASHVDLYDRPQYVGQAVQKMTAFYKKAFAMQEDCAEKARKAALTDAAVTDGPENAAGAEKSARGRVAAKEDNRR